MNGLLFTQSPTTYDCSFGRGQIVDSYAYGAYDHLLKEESWSVDLPSMEGQNEFFFPEGKGLQESKPQISKEISAEVGDDLIMVTNHQQLAVARICVLRDVLDLKISDKDTSLNTGLGNFAEGLVRVPRNYKETWLSQKSLHIEDAFGYIDTLKLKLVVSTKSERQTYSDTSLGKFSDMGNIVHWTPWGFPFHTTMELGSLIQDAINGAQVSKFLPYLPSDFGGAGKPPPFRNPENFIRFVRMYKSGKYQRIATAMIRQTIAFTASMKFGRRPDIGLLLEHFTKCEPVFYDWIKDERQMLSAREVGIPPEILSKKICDLQYGSVESELVPRLLLTRRLVTETAVKIAIQHNALSSALVSADTYMDAKAAFEKTQESWKQDNLFGDNVLNNEALLKEVDLYCRLGDSLRPHEVERFYEYVDKIRKIRHLIRREAVFPREVIDDIYVKGPMLVGDLNLDLADAISLQSTMVDKHSFERDVENTEYLREEDKILDWLASREGDPPRYFVEDDNLLKKECENIPRDKGVIIITDDKRLCREIATEQSRTVCRIPVEYYYRLTYFGDGINDAVRRVPPIRDWVLKEDTGSIQSGEEKYFLDGEIFPEGIPYTPIEFTRPWPSGVTKPPSPRALDYDRLFEPPIGFPWKPNMYMFNGSTGRGLLQMKKRFFARESVF